jgi:hypothetical protein
MVSKKTGLVFIERIGDSFVLACAGGACEVHIRGRFTVLEQVQDDFVGRLLRVSGPTIPKGGIVGDGGKMGGGIPRRGKLRFDNCQSHVQFGGRARCQEWDRKVH